MKEWKTIRGLGSSMNIPIETMMRMRRELEGFPPCKWQDGKMLYNIHEFRDWFRKVEAGEVKYIPIAVESAEDRKMIEEVIKKQNECHGR